ncbi:DUF6754 domain-containing protein [Planctomicrobium piriforme]|uniref:DUF6754 domain-containing protein n=1 Tax=Planctomicrobium piriforme TaxID=1576369 RepID=A0A1I3DC03_9PLAN|nr:DUF6754 domain-containing protein [Planctomicrobium piriforme]SFH84292.1 hypothetical protein SAMN05421753_103176 [Planctomicrobium piriforme]
MRRSLLSLLSAVALLLVLSEASYAAPPAPPTAITASDHPLDDGEVIDVRIDFPQQNNVTVEYDVQRCGEYRGIYKTVETAKPTEKDIQRGYMTVLIGKSIRDADYWFRVNAVNANGEKSAFIGTPADGPVRATRQIFDGSRIWLLVVTLLICGAIVAFILMARWGMPLKVRQIAGLEAIEEAVGRATEMGRSCLFVPGIQDMNEMQTIAGLTILSRVAQRAAEYDCELETPTSKSLVMTAARETVANAFLAAGRPDAYREDLIYYVTDEQFAYVSFLTGKMVREKPAACFYLGSFYAESLILAETGNAIGAIQIAGTAQPAQLPFFVAACDYTLIGEEFFAASAYLSSDPDQLGSLKGQDFGKLLVAALIVIGVGLVTVGGITQNETILAAADYLKNVILTSSG